jgi:hypothetical protein
MIKRKTMIAIIVTGALAVVAAFGAVSYRAVYAQAPTATPGTPANPQQPGQLGPGQFGPGHAGKLGGRGGGGYSDADLAAALGITTDQLTAAYKTATTDAINEALSKGLITQAQADNLLANSANERGLGDLARLGGANGLDYNALLAKALNITTDQLTAAYTTAYNTSLDNAVKNGSLTQAQADAMKAERALANNAKFKAAMQSSYEAAIKQAVTDGVITQAQADALLQQAGQNGGFFGGRGFEHGGPGFGGGRGGRGGPNGGLNNNGQSPAPTNTPSGSGL